MEFRLQVSLEVFLSEIVNFTAVFDLLNVCHQSLEVSFYFVANSFLGSLAAERICYYFFVLTAAIGDEALDKLVEISMTYDSQHLTGNVLHIL